MSRLSIEDVRKNPGFRPVKELRFNEILMFVLENIRIANPYSIFYAVFNILFISLLAGFAVFGFMENDFTVGIFLSIMGWGTIAGSILIIPLHEGLHALAFLMIGAQKIKFGVDFKQMIFYATAEDFVAGRKGFTLVALAPFAMINLISLPLLIFGGIELRLFLIVSLLLHNLMCIGDFAMMSFYSDNKDKELYTFDDLETKTAWFYEKVKVNI
jgi:hypothetical protein